MRLPSLDDYDRAYTSDDPRERRIAFAAAHHYLRFWTPQKTEAGAAGSDCGAAHGGGRYTSLTRTASRALRHDHGGPVPVHTPKHEWRS